MCGSLRTRYRRIPTAAAVMPSTSNQCRLRSATSCRADLSVESCSTCALTPGTTFGVAGGAIQRCGSCESDMLMPGELNDHSRHRSQSGENATARPNYVLHDASTSSDDYLVTRIHLDRSSARLR